jgi:hypothetical protein
MKNRKWLGRYWPFTGRTPPKGAPLWMFHTHQPWWDLCWWDNERRLWVYLSTLPYQTKGTT